ncbi:endolytic transglycosylase MltG, partial [Anaerosalibacter bizertensis]|nr:endolytic transglycosylase MltG [Anaerosalibacter bizertensis]
KELGMVSVKEKIELNEEKDKRETDEKEDTKEEIILFRVENDDTLTSVADRLLKKGLIANKEDFIQFAKYKEADKKLRTGDYKLEKNSSYNEIIKILIKSE